jgi:S1-C subfamily serine protease
VVTAVTLELMEHTELGSTYPRIPGAVAPPPAPPPPTDTRLRVALVGLVAALIGALLGGGAAVVAVDRRVADATRAAVAAAPVPAPVPVAPVVTVDGEELDRVAAVAAAVLPAVVQVDVAGEGALGDVDGNGSGVVYRADGHIITNQHVVARADRLEVVFSDGARAPARVVGQDEVTDLAVIKVDRDGLPAVRIGDSTELTVGELAVAIGSPFGLEGSVTAGVVSALNRPITVPARGGRRLSLPNVIQTDAPINPGNSGGALVGGDGRLIGINSAILTAGPAANAGVGFAIPVNTAVDIADELIERGRVVHPFLGISGDNLNREQSARLGVEKGAYIAEVLPGTPAADAGLRVDDVIVALEGEPVESMEALIIAVRNYEVGERVGITYRRGGREQTVDLTLAERPGETE